MRLAIFLSLTVLLGGCESTYYSINEQFGRLKNDILVDRVEDAMEAQEEAKEEFKDALAQFEAVIGLAESELKSTYNRLSGAFEDAEDKADAVSDRIESVEDVSSDLFEEWQRELSLIGSANLRARSAEQLETSRARAASLIRAMKRAESRMMPVLDSFRDHVLYLKHNLNAQAVASLEGELSGINSDVSRLVEEMEASIAEAQSFIRLMDG